MGDPERAQETEWKRLAAEHAARLVEPGMVLGLGTGSTASLAIEAIGARLGRGELEGVRGVPTSNRTHELATRLGIPLTDLDSCPTLDLTIDGADEVDPQLNLIKGRGGALLREKIVAQASRRNVIVVDERKIVEVLGRSLPLPIEVVRFGWQRHLSFVESAGGGGALRHTTDGQPYLTEEGHLVLDCRFAEGIDDPAGLDRTLRSRAGVVETGLFLDLADTVIVGGRQGVHLLRRGRCR